MTAGTTIPTSRIGFIDLAKGFCILLVVLGHCGVPVDLPGLEVVRMPLYFALSGLFYKDYGSFGALLKKKTNRLLVPFLFFYLIAYVPFYLLQYFAPHLLITDAGGVLDLFTNRQFFNGPVWFLLALFWCNIYYAGICFLARGNAYLVLLLVLLAGGAGYYLGCRGVFVPLFMDVALTAMPFFCLGTWLKKTPLLHRNRFDKYNLLWIILLYLVAYSISRHFHFRLSLHYNAIEGWATYLLAFSSVLAVLLLSKVIRWLPVVSYVGRYSIVLLCTHHLFCRPIKVLLADQPCQWLDNAYLVAALTLVCCLISIPLCVRFLPWFVGQKDLIK
ncbi:acyltransferase [uncultured Alistipes sp.]|jgi:putative acetyltransferase membrane protein|uniref:acyltransferase family protein n=1 Tax=uncultured Alistipes sp. TaxID=538949 RepID=UPI0025E81FE9|nr:acyltransferase [uncultured Alistipes sp.]